MEHLSRSHRFIVRDFTYDEEAIAKGKRELDDLVAEEKQLWVSNDRQSPDQPLLIARVFLLFFLAYRRISSDCPESISLNFSNSSYTSR